MRKVALVVDSTANLPQELIDQYHISILPLTLLWGHESFKDGIDITPDQFYARLTTSSVMPTTSQVTPAQFHQVFTELLAQDFDVLSVLISSKLSGTMDSAIQAKDEIHSERIRLVDSTNASMAHGFIALEAARCAAQGSTLVECAAYAEKLRENIGVLFVVDTLKYLHLGGRIGGGARFLGTAIDLKPILELVDGHVEAIQRVVSKKKAVDRILDLIEQRIDGRTPVHLATVHAKAFDEAKTLLDRASQRFHAVEGYISEVSPVIGVHAGPGVVGLAFLAGA